MSSGIAASVKYLLKRLYIPITLPQLPEQVPHSAAVCPREVPGKIWYTWYDTSMAWLDLSYGGHKEIVRLANIGYNLKQTAASMGHSHHTVKNFQKLTAKHGIERSIDENVTNSEHEKLLYQKGKHLATIITSLTMTTSTSSFPR